MISRQQTDECLAKLGMLKYFPVKDVVVVEVARLLNEICQNDEEARRLTAAVCRQCSEWPGPGKLHELRQLDSPSGSSTESTMDPETARRIREARDNPKVREEYTPEEIEAMPEWIQAAERASRARKARDERVVAGVVCPLNPRKVAA